MRDNGHLDFFRWFWSISETDQIAVDLNIWIRHFAVPLSLVFLGIRSEPDLEGLFCAALT